MVGFSLGQKTCSSYIFFVSPTVKDLHFLTVIIICRVLFSNFEEKMQFSPFPPHFFTNGNCFSTDIVFRP